MENLKEQSKIPNHIAIIPDGNRRWAKNKNLPTFKGHEKGFERVKEIIRESRDLGIHTFTMWGFSTENWNRSKEEIDYLMNIFSKGVKEHLKEAHEDKARVYHLGRKDRLPERLLKELTKAEDETKEYTDHVLNIALDYGGQDELLRALKKAYEDVEKGIINIEDLENIMGRGADKKYPLFLFKNYLDTKEQPHPYPDLIIRTSGEQRLSGFLSWQSAYSELYFAKVHMPDFDKEQLYIALEDYSNRERRFGGNTNNKSSNVNE